MVNDMIAKGLSAKNIKDTYNNINAAMKKAVVLRMIPYNPCEGVSLPKIRLHDFRHSNATMLIMSGVSPKVVQQRLGHSDVNITLNTYTHVLPEMDIEAAEKLDCIMLKKA